MDRKKLYAALVPALMLAACERTKAPPEEASAAPPAPPATETNIAKQAAAPPANMPVAPPDGTDDGSPDLTPPELTSEAERGVNGARNILLSFARAIEQREYGQAWALLSPADKRKWSRTKFAALFSNLDKVTVAIPTGTMEGAAGSSYYTAPVTVTGSDKDGRPVRIAGKAVLRRVNGIDGATPTQLRWHFETLTLDWTH